MIEVLIALGLSVLLISAIYAAVDLHFRIQSAGRGEIAGQQLMRSLIRRMSEDFSSITMHIPEEATTDDPAAEETSTSSSSGTSVANSSPLTSEETDGEESAALTFGLIGDSETLMMTVSKPSRDLSYSSVDMDTLYGRTNDTVTITYGITDAGANRFSLLETDKGHPGTGFAKRTLDLYSLSPLTDPLEPQHVYAEEIVTVAFRYFDGAAWYETWDSQVTGLLPTAIEVTFGVWHDPPPKGSELYDPMKKGTVKPFVHRFFIPLSIPFTDTAI